MFPFFSMLLQWSFFRWIKRIIPGEKWFNYVIMFFFLKMPKILVGRMMLNGETKERMALAWWDKCQSVEWEAMSSNPSWTSAQGL